MQMVFWFFQELPLKANTSDSSIYTGLAIALGGYLAWDLYAGGAFKTEESIDIELIPADKPQTMCDSAMP